VCIFAGRISTEREALLRLKVNKRADSPSGLTKTLSPLTVPPFRGDLGLHRGGPYVSPENVPLLLLPRDRAAKYGRWRERERERGQTRSRRKHFSGILPDASRFTLASETLRASVSTRTGARGDQRINSDRTEGKVDPRSSRGRVKGRIGRRYRALGRFTRDFSAVRVVRGKSGINGARVRKNYNIAALLSGNIERPRLDNARCALTH